MAKMYYSGVPNKSLDPQNWEYCCPLHCDGDGWSCEENNPNETVIN